jgi:Tfp pilus assembly protein PilO
MFSSACRRFTGEIIPVLVVSCAVLAALAAVRFAALPQWQEIRAIRQEASLYRALVSDKNRYQAITAVLVDKKEQLEGRLLRAAPSGGDMPRIDASGLLQDLIQRADKSGIRLDKIQPLDEGQRRARNEYPVVLSMETSFLSLGRFVSSCEESPRLFSIERLAITARKNQLDIKILVTCFPEKAE